MMSGMDFILIVLDYFYKMVHFIVCKKTIDASHYISQKLTPAKLLLHGIL